MDSVDATADVFWQSFLLPQKTKNPTKVCVGKKRQLSPIFFSLMPISPTKSHNCSSPCSFYFASACLLTKSLRCSPVFCFLFCLSLVDKKSLLSCLPRPASCFGTLDIRKCYYACLCHLADFCSQKFQLTKVQSDLWLTFLSCLSLFVPKSLSRQKV